MVTRYEPRYTGWIGTHFHERWHAEHSGTRSYRWTTKTLQAARIARNGRAHRSPA
ncbi:MAG: hypothetical protein ABI988_08100 [Nitrospirota bacterium]